MLRLHRPCKTGGLVSIRTLTSRVKTTTSTTASSTDPATLSKLSNHTLISPFALFPWKHSSYLPNRMYPGNDEHFTIGPLGPGMPPSMNRFQRAMCSATAAREMGIPWYRIIFASGVWQEELAGQFAWSFGRGVAGLVGNTFHVPVNDIEVLDSDLSKGIRVDYESTRTEKENDNDESTEKSPPESSLASPSIDPLTLDDNLIGSMLEANLRNLYSNAREQRGNLEIRLSTLPVRADLISLIFIPVLTRRQVRNRPKLEGSFQRFLSELAVLRKEGMGVAELGVRASDMLYELSEKVGNYDGVETTIVAQVSVDCREVFWVKDVASGKILQGNASGGERDVKHLVRFEMVTKKDADGNIETGSWQITDWDDLLDGNVFF